jgi:NAD-dependent DNA ligase
MRTVKECLNAIGVTSADFEGCGSLEDEFKSIKKIYRQKVLVCHPDKGGDTSIFRDVRTSFEELRRMYDADTVLSFATQQAAEASTYDTTYQDFGDMPTPSWEFFYTAAEEDVPLYRVEAAKSGRSLCRQKGKAKNCSSGESEKIPKGDVRIGAINEDTGSHTWWVHLTCWRVPSKIWLGVPDPEECDDPKMFEQALLAMNEVLLSGLSDLSPESKQAFVEHVMDKENWARLVKRKPKQKEEDGDAAVTEAKEQEKKAVVLHGKHEPSKVFVIPAPGKNGAVKDMLAGKTVVMTGTFPEVGGGIGLNLGKDKVKRMIESFGGRVTSAVSGKTDILVLGKDPGFSKVSKSQERGVQLVALKALKEALEGGRLEDAPRPVAITNFSAGYRGNSAALGASDEAVAIAASVQVPQIKASTMKRPPGEENTKSAYKNPKKQKAISSKDLNATANKKPKKQKKTSSKGLDATAKKKPKKQKKTSSKDLDATAEAL